MFILPLVPNYSGRHNLGSLKEENLNHSYCQFQTKHFCLYQHEATTNVSTVTNTGFLSPCQWSERFLQRIIVKELVQWNSKYLQQAKQSYFHSTISIPLHQFISFLLVHSVASPSPRVKLSFSNISLTLDCFHWLLIVVASKGPGDACYAACSVRLLLNNAELIPLSVPALSWATRWANSSNFLLCPGDFGSSLACLPWEGSKIRSTFIPAPFFSHGYI